MVVNVHDAALRGLCVSPVQQPTEIIQYQRPRLCKLVELQQLCVLAPVPTVMVSPYHLPSLPEKQQAHSEGEH